MELFMNLSGQCWILSKYFGFGLIALNQTFIWIYHTRITLNPLIRYVSLSPFYFMKWIGIYSQTHKPALWLTADAEIMRCFTVLRVVIALAWCVKIKATLCLCVIVILDHTCYLSAWADCNQTLTVHTLSLTVLGSIISFTSVIFKDIVVCYIWVSLLRLLKETCCPFPLVHKHTLAQNDMLR